MVSGRSEVLMMVEEKFKDERNYLQIATLIRFMLWSCQEHKQSSTSFAHLKYQMPIIPTTCIHSPVPVFVKIDLLQNSVTADCQQYILLQLLVLGECLHGIKVGLHNVLQDLGVNLCPKLRLGEVEEASGGRHLDGEDGGILPRTAQHPGDDIHPGYRHVYPGLVVARGHLEQVVEGLLDVLWPC